MLIRGCEGKCDKPKKQNNTQNEWINFPFIQTQSNKKWILGTSYVTISVIRLGIEQQISQIQPYSVQRDLKIFQCYNI